MVCLACCYQQTGLGTRSGLVQSQLHMSEWYKRSEKKWLLLFYRDLGRFDSASNDVKTYGIPKWLKQRPRYELMNMSHTKKETNGIASPWPYLLGEVDGASWSCSVMLSFASGFVNGSNSLPGFAFIPAGVWHVSEVQSAFVDNASCWSFLPSSPQHGFCQLESALLRYVQVLQMVWAVGLLFLSFRNEITLV